jgi:hypothetical protein
MGAPGPPGRQRRLSPGSAAPVAPQEGQVSRPPLVAPNGAPVDHPAEGAQPITITKSAAGGLIISVPPDTSPGDLVQAAHLLSRAANRMIDAAEYQHAVAMAAVREDMAGGKPS